jgi:predicted glycosyltransferase
VWVDCTAAAHPLVLRPIIERLEAAGHEVEVTARAYGQTEGVLDRLRIPYTSIGRHGGRSVIGKAAALASRSPRLWRWARGRGFDLALAHGSVDIAVVSRALRVPLVQMNDYEHAGLQRRISFRAARLVIAPDAIPIEAMERGGARRDRLFRYPGLKEDYYLADFRPDPEVVPALGLPELGVSAERDSDQRVLVVVRPPPETSEYHTVNPLYDGVIERLVAEERAVTVAIPRTAGQGERLRERARRDPDAALVVPERAVDAQSLIAYADLVVSAGGTMNREAVALGAPVYTIFSGRIGAVDARLIEQRRLRVLGDPGELELRRRETGGAAIHPRDPKVLADAVLGAAPRPGHFEPS